MISNILAEIVQEEWERTSIVRQGIALEAFVIMPNHVHALLTIKKDGGAITVGASRRLAPTNSRPHTAASVSPHGAIPGWLMNIQNVRV